MNPKEIDKKKLSYFWFLLVCTVFLSEGRVEAYVSVDADYFKQQGQVTVERIYDALYNDNNIPDVIAPPTEITASDLKTTTNTAGLINPFLSIHYGKLLNTAYKTVNSITSNRQIIISFIIRISTPHLSSEGIPSFLA
jgi:hypothetical protein